MSCVAWPNQTPIGTASNFLQCKWVSCSKSYWQGYDLGWYKDMGVPCFPQPNLWLARCASMSWTALKKFVVLSTQELRIGKNLHSIAGGKRGRFVGAPSTPSVVSVPSCAVLPSAPSCEMVRDGVDGEHNDTTALCDRNVSFQPARNIPSLCWCLPPVPPVSAIQGDRDCYFLFRQNVCTSGSSSSRRKQQQQEEATAAGGSSRRSRRSKQQQARSSSSKQQQQAAASSSSKQQQAAASSSKQQQAAASSKQQQQRQTASSSKQKQAAASSSKQKQAEASRSSGKEQQGAARSSNNRQAVGERQVSSSR